MSETTTQPFQENYRLSARDAVWNGTSSTTFGSSLFSIINESFLPTQRWMQPVLLKRP
jgi:hypothetical protein